MRPIQRSRDTTSVMSFGTLNVVIPSKPENLVDKFSRKNYNNVLRMCSFKGCGYPKENKENKLHRAKQKKYEKAIKAMQDILNEKDDTTNETDIIPCSESKGKCGGLRARADNIKQYFCNCGKFDYTCKLKCQQRNEDTAVLKRKRCGCDRNDYTCMEKCFNNDQTEQTQTVRCGCSKTDRICQVQCRLQEEYKHKQELIRCGCGKTDRVCQDRCLGRNDLSLRSVVRCSCAITDRMCQERCLNHDDSALRNILRCGCEKTDRICKETCFQSDTVAIQNQFRCGCNVTDFSCLDRCARNKILGPDSSFLNCGCNLSDYACRLRCERTANGWREPNNRICNCENYDHDCKEQCQRHYKETNTIDSLISHVASKGKRYKINNDVDVVVYDPLNLARILDGIKFNNNKIRSNQGQHILPILEFDNNESTNKGFQPAVKPVTKIDSNQRTNKGKSQEIDQVLKELQNAKMVEFDIGHVQTEHNWKFQTLKPTKFIDMLLEFATKIKNATSKKQSDNVYSKASITKLHSPYGISSGTNERSQKKTSKFGPLSLQEPRNVNHLQKKDDDTLDSLYEILRSGPDRDIERRNENRDDDSRNQNLEDGMDFANDVVQSLQDYLYARRKSREKRRKDDDHDSNHPHQKHSLLPLTKRQKMKRLNGQVGRSLIKFRRNLPADKVDTYGVPFELDIQGMGQVNFVEALQLLNA